MSLRNPPVYKNCAECGKSFKSHVCLNRKLCSKSCMSGYMKKNINNGNFRNRPIKDDRHHMWKGDGVGYWALHDWVQRRLGNGKYCEHCGTTNISKRYEWANVSQEYRRDLNDWIRLCKKCHLIFDGVAERNAKKMDGRFYSINGRKGGLKRHGII